MRRNLHGWMWCVMITSCLIYMAAGTAFAVTGEGGGDSENQESRVEEADDTLLMDTTDTDESVYEEETDESSKDTEESESTSSDENDSNEATYVSDEETADADRDSNTDQGSEEDEGSGKESEFDGKGTDEVKNADNELSEAESDVSEESSENETSSEKSENELKDDGKAKETETVKEDEGNDGEEIVSRVVPTNAKSSAENESSSNVKADVKAEDENGVYSVIVSTNGIDSGNTNTAQTSDEAASRKSDEQTKEDSQAQKDTSKEDRDSKKKEETTGKSTDKTGESEDREDRSETGQDDKEEISQDNNDDEINDKTFRSEESVTEATGSLLYNSELESSKTDKGADLAADGALSDLEVEIPEDVFSIVVPTVEADIFDFMLDPQNLLSALEKDKKEEAKSDKAKKRESEVFGASERESSDEKPENDEEPRDNENGNERGIESSSNEPRNDEDDTENIYDGSTVYFRRRGEPDRYTDTSDVLYVVNKSTIPVRIHVDLSVSSPLEANVRYTDFDNVSEGTDCNLAFAILPVKEILTEDVTTISDSSDSEEIEYEEARIIDSSGEIDADIELSGSASNYTLEEVNAVEGDDLEENKDTAAKKPINTVENEDAEDYAEDFEVKGALYHFVPKENSLWPMAGFALKAACNENADWTDLFNIYKEGKRISIKVSYYVEAAEADPI